MSIDAIVGIHHFCIIGWFPAYKKSILETTGNQNPPDLGQGGSGYLFFPND